jgi:hypothetical protein
VCPGCAPLLFGFCSLGWWCALARQVVRSSARNHLGVAACGYGQSLVRLLWPCRAVGFSTLVVSARGSGQGPVKAARSCGEPRGDQLAVGLQGQREGLVVAAGNAGGHLVAAAEGRV